MRFLLAALARQVSFGDLQPHGAKAFQNQSAERLTCLSVHTIKLDAYAHGDEHLQRHLALICGWR
jgi:hypothetical protein